MVAIIGRRRNERFVLLPMLNGGRSQGWSNTARFGSQSTVRSRAQEVGCKDNFSSCLRV